MTLSPKLIGPAISMITGLITSTSMSFVGLAMNYGFQPDFAVRWPKAAATSYVVIVPMLVIVIPRIQRFVMRQAGLPAR
jgi:ABC-type glycerol-3-phosphate transport system permease component